MANLAYGTLTITNLSVVTSVDVYYYNSTSPTTLSGDTWRTDTPTWTNGKYVWSKTVTTWEQGVTTQSEPVCITGQKGSTGAAGQSVIRITQQYALGSNSTTAPTTGWDTTMPPFESGKFYWTRSEIVWANPTSTTHTTAVLANGITSANTTAATANSNASAAVITANSADSKADSAISTANTANETAQNAVSIANGKNTIYYSSSKPTGESYKPGDTWFFLTDDGYRIYEYDTTSSDWVQKPMDGKSITAGTVTAAQIQAGAITTNKLATDAIKSGNYQAGTAPYSGAGTFLDLSNGNIYSPNFGINNSNDNITDGAYIKGSIYAYDGTIGSDENNYWQIGNYGTFDQSQYATIRSHGKAFMQLGDTSTWRISTNRIHTAWYDDNDIQNLLQLHYITYENKYWDLGFHIPTSENDKFIYIRNSSTNKSLSVLQGDLEDNSGANAWNYQFYITRDGNLYAKNFYLLDGTQIAGSDGVYLLKSGGTITGALTINSTLQVKGNYLDKNGAALTLQTNLNSETAATLTGDTTNTIKIGVTGTLPTSKGGTGSISFTSKGIVYASGTDPQTLLSTAAGTSGQLLSSGGSSGSPSWVNASSLSVNHAATAEKATKDKNGNDIVNTYMPFDGGTFTGNVVFNNDIKAPSLNKGQVIYVVKGTQTTTTASWTGQIPIDSLYDGLTIAYYLPRKSASNVTLSLTLADGTSTFAIPVYYGATRLGDHYAAGTTVFLTYWSAGSIQIDGNATTADRWTLNEYNTNSNTIGEYIGTVIAGPNGMARYSLIIQVDNEHWESLVLTSSNAATKTKNSSGFLLTSPIYYQSGGTYAEGAGAGQSSVWSTASVDSRYSLNVSNSWSLAGKSLYLVGSIIDNKFYLKDTTWWADELPNEADGYYYWYVGQMYNKYQFTLAPIHPIWYYENGQLKQLFVQNLTNPQIIDGLGYTPYNATNPNGYTTNTGTVTSVAASGSGGITISGSPITTSGTLAIGLNLSTAINGLGEGTSAANRNDYAVVQYAGGGTSTTTYHRRKLSNVFKALIADDIPDLAWSKITSGNDDLKAIEALEGTTGLLKKTATNTWTLDTNAYLTEITSNQITTALGYIPYDSTNPDGYTTNAGTVTQITAGTGLKIGSASSGGNITTSGTINHINSVTAQSTQALYPIKIDGQGHISAYGAAVTSLPASDVSAWAKAANKPSYTYSEIGGTPSSLKNPNALQIKVYNGSSTSSDISYDGSTANQSVSVAGASAITGITSTADGKLQLTLADGTQPAAISVKITATTSDSAASADKLNLSADVGSLIQPVFFDANTGLPVATSYTIEKSVPSNAIFTDTTYTFDGTYNASSNKAATVSTVTNAINALDGNLNNTTPGAGKTLTAFSQTNGKISATFGNISITKSQISDFPDTLTPAAHTHGNITNDGDITTTVTIASGDRLVINDESEGKINNSSITFGTSTTTYLTNKGTWATPVGTTYTFDGTYNASTNKAATVSTVTNAINALDGGTIGTGGVGKTITSLSQTNGQVSATFADINITKSQISDFPSALTPTAHTHGNISNTGIITSTTVKLGNGDNLLFVDSSNDGKIERSSITIGTGTTKYLRQDGTWGTPAGTYSLPLAANGTRGGVQIGYTESGKKYAVKLDSEKMYVEVPWTNTTYDAATANPLMDGTAAVGTSVKYARQDHKHPTDTTRVPTSRTINGHGLSTDITISKSDIGLGNVENTKLSTWAGSGNLTTTAVGTLGSAATYTATDNAFSFLESDEAGYLPTVGAIGQYLNAMVTNYDETIVHINNEETVVGRKTFNNLATTTFMSGSESEYCNINYDQTLSALVFSFG